MIWLKDLKSNNCSLDIKNEIRAKIERIKHINGNIYAYAFNDSIKVYDDKTLKLKADLKLPFIRKEPLLDILDNEVLIYMASGKLYFYKINIPENKFEFMYYLSNVYSFHYLSKRKEILLLTEPYIPYLELNEQFGMAKSYLMGNIILANKITPKINHKFVSPEETNDFLLSPNSEFSTFYGLLIDQYIININGYFYEYDVDEYRSNSSIFEVGSRINIYKADDLKLILEERHPKYLNYVKMIIYLNSKKKKYFSFIMRKKIKSNILIIYTIF